MKLLMPFYCDKMGQLFSFRINLLFYLYFPLSLHPKFVCFSPVGLLLLLQHFQHLKDPLKMFY
jgi:hypothetical protein